MTEPDRTACGHCRQLLHPRYISLERRIEQVRMLPGIGGSDLSAEDARESLTECIEPLTGEEVACYCNQVCWLAVEDDWIERLALKDPFPTCGVMVACSRCGNLIDRTKLHVSYNIIDGVLTRDGAGNATLDVFDDTALAVLCNDCDSAAADADAAEENDHAGVVAFT